MASAPQSNPLPIFYNDLLPLSTQEHAGWHTRALDSAPFLAKQHAVPLTVDEFIPASRFIPIVFSSGEDPVPLGLMALNEGMNTMFDDSGKLNAAAYVPAYIRRYPWMLAKLRPDSEEMSLCFDPTSGAVGAFEEGEVLFTDGAPSEATQNILKFCEEFETAAQRTGQFMKELKEAGLLMEGEVSIQLPDGQPFVYRGFQMVNEEALREMRGDQLRKINQNGMLPLLYAHLFSLQLMTELFRAQVEQGKMPNVTLPQGVTLP